MINYRKEPHALFNACNSTSVCIAYIHACVYDTYELVFNICVNMCAVTLVGLLNPPTRSLPKLLANEANNNGGCVGKSIAPN